MTMEGNCLEKRHFARVTICCGGWNLDNKLPKSQPSGEVQSVDCIVPFSSQYIYIHRQAKAGQNVSELSQDSKTGTDLIQVVVGLDQHDWIPEGREA